MPHSAKQQNPARLRKQIAKKRRGVQVIGNMLWIDPEEIAASEQFKTDREFFRQFFEKARKQQKR